MTSVSTLVSALVLVAPAALSHDLAKSESLLIDAYRSHQPEIRILAADQLSAALRDSTLSSKDFNTAVDLVVNYRVTEVVPVLIEKINREGYELSLMKPWWREFPCTRALVQLGDASVNSLLQSVLHEEQQLRRDLMLYSVLGILGPVETQKRLEQAGMQLGGEAAKATAAELVQRAKSLAPLAPTHLAPKRGDTASGKAFSVVEPSRDEGQKVATGPIEKEKHTPSSAVASEPPAQPPSMIQPLKKWLVIGGCLSFVLMLGAIVGLWLLIRKSSKLRRREK